MTSILGQDRASLTATIGPALQPRSRQVIGGTCLVLVPIGWAIAEVLAPESGSTAARILSGYAGRRDSGLASAAVSLVTLVLFLPAFFALVSPITGRGRRWGHAGLAAMVYSTVTIAALVGVNIMFHAMTAPGLDRGAMVAAVDQLQKNPLVLPVLAGHWVMGLGVLFLGIAVVRSRQYAAWTGYAIMAWFVVDLVASMLPVGEVAGALASNAVALAGLGSIGLAMLRGRD
jgi:hypothetical protein